jgi:hypothetical protein
VVAFAVTHAKDRSYWHWYHRWDKANALTRASTQGHADVVQFLLEDREGVWDIAGAFEAAAIAEEHVVALVLKEAYERGSRRNLFIDMATAGRSDAVKYLYNKTCVESGLVHDGFLSAVVKERNDVVEFFLGTGGVSSDLFDNAMELASRSDKITSFTLLYSKKRASAQSLARAFEDSGSLAITKFLYENERVTQSSITCAFHNAALYDFGAPVNTFSSERCQQSIDIVTFLHAEECIPSEVMSEAFSHSVARQPLEVVKTMLKMHTIAPEAVGESLVQTSSNGRPLALVQLLVGVRSIPQLFLDKALVQAARRGRKRALRVMHQHVEWLKDAVVEALRLTKNRKIRKMLQAIQTYW